MADGSVNGDEGDKGEGDKGDIPQYPRTRVTTTAGAEGDPPCRPCIRVPSGEKVGHCDVRTGQGDRRNPITQTGHGDVGVTVSRAAGRLLDGVAVDLDLAVDEVHG